MEKVFGICPICQKTISVDPEKETCHCVKCGKEITIQESIQLYKKHGGDPSAPAPHKQPQQEARPKNRTKSPDIRIDEMFQLCNKEEDFLMLRSNIQNMAIPDHEKSKLLDVLNKKTAIRLQDTLAKAKEYSESQESPASMIIGCIIIAAIGLAINYFFSKTWPGIIMCALAVLGVIGNLADRANKTKVAENKRAAELIQAYRDQGYQI